MPEPQSLSPFERWYFTAKSKTRPELPMATELIYYVCSDDRKRFDLVNQYLEEAFNAGYAAKVQRSDVACRVGGGDSRGDEGA